jgi:two-component system nitrate/nitrite response regulator NarL
MRIILIDRHSVPRLGLTTLLNAKLAGASISEFDSAQDGLAAVLSEPGDLVLCGRSTGFELGPNWISQLVAVARPGKVVVLAGRPDAASCELTRAAGASGHLPMTCSPELMTAAINLILAGGTYFPAIEPVVLGERGLRPLTMSKAPQMLTRRQLQVLGLVAHGLSNKEIAGALALSDATVKLHVQAILKALGARNRTEAARIARDESILD